MQIEHPRAARGKRPPSKVSIKLRDARPVDEDGFFECPNGRAVPVMDALERKYDVEYNEDGTVKHESDESEDEPPPDSDPSFDPPLEDRKMSGLKEILKESDVDSDDVDLRSKQAIIDAIKDAKRKQEE